MLHLASYIMMPFMAGSSIAAPVTDVSSSTGMNTLPQDVANAGNQQLITSLAEAATSVDRLKLLPNDRDHIYDFNNPPKDAITTGDGGHTVKADRKDFPALIGNGVSMTVGFIGPCGFNTPHTHPRSAEINIIVEGRLGTEYILENGLGVIRNELSKFQMTVFPQGAIHTEFNPDCTNATFVAGFASEDPGVQQSAQRLFDLDEDVLTAAFASDFTFDGRDLEQFKGVIPKNVANGVEACLKKCNIQKR
ncbi:uncharacterized protein HMPREF1541_00860 [Cyphellophora europaea CBS 101466]|uniref:Cupin type-1 domain-containing protein n=1 Tax=Cyphellophora europaea (strain CBS 101466) TaxID=1220924 RepID=W2SF61_CYPE1|nr:uncharacterized protein HMPREF1541_00860 [Cyphellophora europaea CBS 101466]ETN46673.1 hypothetical protein HMPREF1541_00860 [Cyphellophora europaea CBS 101466]